MTFDPLNAGLGLVGIPTQCNEADQLLRAAKAAILRDDGEAFFKAAVSLTTVYPKAGRDLLHWCASLNDVPASIRDAAGRLLWSVGTGWFPDNEHPTLIKALRVLLGRYDGPPLQIYRSENIIRYSTRRIGLFWAESIEKARRYISDPHLRDGMGSVLLSTVAPADAICFAYYGTKRECLVDYRKLSAISVIDTSPPTSALGAFKLTNPF